MENVYTFVGKDTSFVLKEVDKKIKELNISNSKVTKFDFTEITLPILMRELNSTGSFFSDIENKIVILYNIDFFVDEKDYDVSLINMFLKYLARPTDTIVLFLCVDDLKKVNKNILDSINKNTLIVKCDQITPDKFNEYIKNEFNKNGYTIDRDAIKELVLRTKDDYSLLNNDVEKLLLYRNDSKNISIEDVYQLTSRNLDSNVFDLVDAVILNNKKRSYDIYKDLKAVNMADSLILGSLIFKFREMATTKRLINDKLTKNEIAEALHVKPGRAYYMMKNVSNYNLKTIVEKLNDLLDIDYRLKTGRINESLALITFLLV